MTKFEELIWAAAFASQLNPHVADVSVHSFRENVAAGTAGLPVTEGNVCDHKGKDRYECAVRGILCDGCGATVES